MKRMLHIGFILLLIFGSTVSLRAQNVSINADGAAPDTSAMLDVSSTVKGLLLPRMTQTQRDAIAGPATGLMIFQTGLDSGFYFNSGSPASPNWLRLETSDDNTSSIEDEDGDTQIQTEKFTDEDIIRFDAGGTEVMRIDDFSRINVSNARSSLFIGSAAGNAITSGTQNTFLGYEAGAFTSSGSSNTFMGYRAGYVNGTTGSNTFIGALSGDANNSGQENTFVGLSSGSATNSGSHNTFIGKNAGRINSTGDNNTYLGVNSGDITAGSGNVFLGAYSGSALGSADDILYIENSNSNTPLVFGDFAADSISINGKLSVGSNYTFPTTTPTSGQVLRHNGSGLEWGTDALGTSPWTASGNFIYSIADSIGIGTTVPNYLLEIQSSTTINDPFIFLNNANSSEGDAYVLFEADANENFSVGVNGSGNRNFVIANSFNLESNQRFVVDGSTGNIGIGTTSPLTNLHIRRDTGDVILRLQADQDGNNNEDNPEIWFLQDAGQISKIGRESVAGTEFTNSLNNAFYMGQSGTRPVQFYTNNNARMTILSGGNVGIGTNAPNYNFHIQGTSSSEITAAIDNQDANGYSILRFNNDAGDQTVLFHNGSTRGADGGAGSSTLRNDGVGDLILTSTSADLVLQPNGRNVGIGTAAPSSELDVVGDVEVGSTDAFYFGDPSTDGSWRIVRDGNDLSFERRELGTWVFKMKINP